MTKEYEQAVVEKLLSFLLPEIQAILNNELPRLIDEGYNSPLIKSQKSMKIEEGFYSPRLDIGVGPYAFQPGNLNSLYSTLLKKRNTCNLIKNIAEKGFYLLKTINEGFIENSDCINQNDNARCFLAIEIENKTTRKHFMGSSLNASMMGKIGIVICEGESARNLEKLFGYIKEMIHREKSPEIMKNVIWIKKEEFDKVINNL